METELQDLIKAAKEFKAYQSIGNGAKLNCAIEAAELVAKRESCLQPHTLKSKEDILGTGFTPEQCGSGIECVTRKDAVDAMSVYAEQQSVLFIGWLYASRWKLGNGIWSKGELQVTTNELYKIFLIHNK